MKTVDSIIEEIIGIEGGYSNNPLDRGGATRWGVTEKKARQHGYKGDMRDLPREFARDVFLTEYFLEPRFDKIYELSPSVAAELTDSGINLGVGFAKPAIQDALNLLNRNQQDYKEIEVDGKIGPATIAALAAYLAKRGKQGEITLLKLLNVLQGARYVEICRKNPSQETFLTGWLNNRVSI